MTPILAFALLALQRPKATHRTSAHQQLASVRQFAQRFYDWYTPKVFNEKIDAEHLALTQKAAAFSPELRKALLDDWTAQDEWTKKGNDGIVGIDWDPFLSGQDPAHRYWVRNITHKGKFWYVSVWSSYGDQSHEPDVVAKVEKSKGKFGWSFTNFLYGKERDLLSALRALKEQREH